MIDVKYDNDGIRVNLLDVSKYNDNLPYKFKVIKHVSGEVQWECELSDNWFGTYPNTEIFDIEITDSLGNMLYEKKWDINYGNRFYKSLWLYNKNLTSKGITPKGLAIGTHDGEFGEWVPLALKRECNLVLVEASDNQYDKLYDNYKDIPQVKTVKSLITPNGGDVEFFEGGRGYTNSVVERVINHWETEEIFKSVKKSISITDLILNECDGKIDWLHLDVEGLDAQLIMGIDESKITLPNYIIFEDDNLTDDEKNEIYSWLRDRQYKLVSENGICDAKR